MDEEDFLFLTASNGHGSLQTFTRDSSKSFSDDSLVTKIGSKHQEETVVEKDSLGKTLLPTGAKFPGSSGETDRKNEDNLDLESSKMPDVRLFTENGANMETLSTMTASITGNIPGIKAIKNPPPILVETEKHSSVGVTEDAEKGFEISDNVRENMEGSQLQNFVFPDTAFPSENRPQIKSAHTTKNSKLYFSLQS